MEWKADGWPGGFSWSASAAAILDHIDRAFSAVEPPLYFTNVDHCEECHEYHDMLSARPRMELRREDLGDFCWNPLPFTSPQGTAHLMPALARYTMGPDYWPGLGWYAEQMICCLDRDGVDNEFLRFCDVEQQAAVSAMIGWMIESKADQLNSYLQDWLSAFEVWRVD